MLDMRYIRIHSPIWHFIDGCKKNSWLLHISYLSVSVFQGVLLVRQICNSKRLYPTGGGMLGSYFDSLTEYLVRGGLACSYLAFTWLL